MSFLSRFYVVQKIESSAKRRIFSLKSDVLTPYKVAWQVGYIMSGTIILDESVCLTLPTCISIMGYVRLGMMIVLEFYTGHVKYNNI